MGEFLELVRWSLDSPIPKIDHSSLSFLQNRFTYIPGIYPVSVISAHSNPHKLPLITAIASVGIERLIESLSISAHGKVRILGGKNILLLDVCGIPDLRDARNEIAKQQLEIAFTMSYICVVLLSTPRRQGEWEFVHRTYEEFKKKNEFIVARFVVFAVLDEIVCNVDSEIAVFSKGPITYIAEMLEDVIINCNPMMYRKSRGMSEMQNLEMTFGIMRSIIRQKKLSWNTQMTVPSLKNSKASVLPLINWNEKANGNGVTISPIKVITLAKEMIEQKFAEHKRVVPLLVLGSRKSGKQSLLDQFVPPPGPFQLYGKCPGLCFYSEPVPVNTASVLLMKSSTVAFENYISNPSCREVISKLLSFVGVTLVCVDYEHLKQYLVQVRAFYERESNPHSKIFIIVNRITQSHLPHDIREACSVLQAAGVMIQFRYDEDSALSCWTIITMYIANIAESQPVGFKEAMRGIFSGNLEYISPSRHISTALCLPLVWNRFENSTIEINAQLIETIRILSENCRIITPLVELTDLNFRSDSILDLIAENANFGKPFEHFGDFCGITAFTKLIQSKDNCFLLLRLSFNNLSNLSDTAKRFAHIAFSIASVVFFNIKREDVIMSLSEIYKEMTANCQLFSSKWVLCQDNSLKTHSWFEWVSIQNPASVTSLISSLRDESALKAYISSHCSVTLQSILTTLVNLSNTCQTYQEYAWKAPNFAALQQTSKSTTHIQSGSAAPEYNRGNVMPSPGKICKCELLMTWPDLIEQQTNFAPKVNINPQLVDLIKRNFAGCNQIVTLLKTGESGMRDIEILDYFVSQGTTEKPFAVFPDYSGLLVYPNPVTFGPFQLLLMEMSPFQTKSQTEVDTFTKKLIHSLLSITAMCFICGNIWKLRESAEFVAECSARMSKACYVNEPRKTLIVKSEDLWSKIASGMEPFLNEKNIGVLFESAPDLSAHFSASSFDSYFGLLYSCQTSMNQPSQIATICEILTTQIQMTNFPLSLDQFYERMPNLTDPHYKDRIQSTEQLLRIPQLSEYATTIDLFESRGSSLVLKTGVMNAISKNVDLSKPLAVIAAFGKPGLGKSTLLNHIAHRLFRRNVFKPFFRASNTTSHTTIGAQMLSMPAMLPSDTQVMLMDLEGLGGMEIVLKDKKTKQDLLIDKVLSMTSVYLFFVVNAESSLEFLREKINRIAKVNNDFGYKTGRILILFHDKSCGRCDNEVLNSFVREMNINLFERREVVQVLCKPSFVNVSVTEAEKEKFLEILREHLEFPKEFKNGRKLTAGTLFETWSKQ